ncbi:thermonuclease family protein [Aquimarina sp. I32.4]|uniref:thermonuclease family protein n=1 Tax=Aquimarina sp. I32.4 TaxID=2053903 RepID=UPI000CDF17E3|nr:thermonuclease family protein [Aquimarina sp. I32.4]
MYSDLLRRREGLICWFFAFITRTVYSYPPIFDATKHSFAVAGATVIITTTKQNKDQYARYIAEVIYNDTNMSDYLIDKNVAKFWKE